MIDFSHEAHIIQVAIAEASMQIVLAWTAPHILMKPQLRRDGSMWCAIYGENLVEGIAGFGETPAAAMEAFDNAWRTERTPASKLAAMGGAL